MRVIIATDTAVEAMVAWSELGKYVAVDVRRANSEFDALTDAIQRNAASGKETVRA